MATFNWAEIHGQKFTDSEAREASDFDEILNNFAIEPTDAFQMFECESLPVSRRLVLAVKAPLEDIAIMMLGELDFRIMAIIEARIKDFKDVGVVG